MRNREVDNQSIVEYTDSFQRPQQCGWTQLTGNLKIINNGEATLSILRGVQRFDVANLPGLVGDKTPGDITSSIVRQAGQLVAGVTSLACGDPSFSIGNRVGLHQLG